jgi:glyoxylase-like metal-dependent hydrolase (beta-lactamase superfamily II)
MDCNTYVIKDETTILIDPGLIDYLSNLQSALHNDGIDPEDIDIICNTHLHIDHCWANEAFKEQSGAKILMLPVQKEYYETATTQTSKFFGIPKVQFQEDSCFTDNKIDVGDMEIEFINCPGHSPDSIVYYCPKEKFIICGDVIFSYNTGRVDLPGGSAEQLKQSVNKLSELDLEYVLPGHMNVVAGADNVKKNFEYIQKAVFQWL